MDEFRTLSPKQKISIKFNHWLQEIWPSVYRTINELLWGIVRFLKFLIRGLWPGK